MGRQSLRPVVDLALGGGLADYLSGLRSNGASYEGMARQLAADHKVDVTGETVRKWCQELGIVKPGEAA